MKCINRKKFIQYDCSFKGKLLELRREVCMDKHGKKRSYHFFAIRCGFFRKKHVFIGSASLDLRSYYEIGRKVKHISGYTLPEKMNSDCFDYRICIECGERVLEGEHYCPYCGRHMTHVSFKF